jgi:hypothetical protein
MNPMTTSRWEQLAATRHNVAPRSIDLTELPEHRPSSRGQRYRAELALIQAYIDALRPQPEPARR